LTLSLRQGGKELRAALSREGLGRRGAATTSCCDRERHVGFVAEKLDNNDDESLVKVGLVRSAEEKILTELEQPTRVRKSEKASAARRPAAKRIPLK
jgi:hypothetical protein